MNFNMNKFGITIKKNKLGLTEGACYTAKPVEWFRFDSVDEKNRFVQGGCFTGESFIIAFIENDNEESRVKLAEIGTNGKIIRTSQPLDLDHANNLAYNTNRGEIIVSHCQQNGGDRYSYYSFVDPATFEITEAGELERPFFSIGYSFERELYGSGEWCGGTIDVWDKNLSLLRSFKVETPETLSQGVWCDDCGIWFVRSSQYGYPCEIRVYDWENGSLKFQIPIDDMEVEPENLTVYGEEAYIVCNNKEYNGGIVYKLSFTKEKQY